VVSKVELDDYDRKILRALQENADFSMADLGNLIGLSHTPCWRRLKRLETEGVIRGKVTLLDAKKIDLGVRVHAFVTAKNHDEEALSAFEAAVQSIPEIVECYSTSGDKDYVLQSVPCTFLDQENYCMIYDVRPKACREFPHTDRKKFQQISDLTLKNVAICPAAYAIVEEMKKKLPL